MKIKPEHLALMRAAFATLDTDFYRSRYVAAGLTTRRFAWDCLHAAQQRGLLPARFVIDTLYQYANDDHIDTALRKLIKPLDQAA